MSTYQFPGLPAFLRAAAAQLGHPGAVGSARPLAALAALANLCAQAVEAEARHVPAILAQAERFRDQARLACRAAELMLDEVRAALNPIGAGAGRDPAAPPSMQSGGPPRGGPPGCDRPPRSRGAR